MVSSEYKKIQPRSALRFGVVSQGILGIDHGHMTVAFLDFQLDGSGLEPGVDTSVVGRVTNLLTGKREQFGNSTVHFDLFTGNHLIVDPVTDSPIDRLAGIHVEPFDHVVDLPFAIRQMGSTDCGGIVMRHPPQGHEAGDENENTQQKNLPLISVNSHFNLLVNNELRFKIASIILYHIKLKSQ